MESDGEGFSTEDLRHFFDISQALLCVTDVSGRLVRLSPSWQDVLGWDPGPMVGHHFLEFLHPDDAEHTLAALQAAADPDVAPEPIVNRYRHADGSYRTLSWLTRTAREGDVVWCVAQDVTGAEVRARQQQLVADLGRRALDAVPHQELLQDIVDGVATALSLPVVSVLELTPDGAHLQISRAHGMGEHSDDLLQIDQTTLSGQAVLSSVPVQSTDVQASGGNPLQVAVQARGAVSVPIRLRGALWGALSCADGVPRQFTEDEVRFLQQVAHIVGAAVDRRETEVTLQHIATHDRLTGLPNRDLFRLFVEGALERSTATHHPVGLLLCDLDGFKDVNDSLGHEAGDEVLRQLSARLSGAVGPEDTVARLGGDEFAICLVGRHTEVDVLGMADTIIRAMRQPFALPDMQVPLSTSIGVVVSPTHGRDATTLLRHADIAMYRAKANGVGWSRYDVALDRATGERLARTADLRDAIAQGQLQVKYQPVIDLRTRRLHGVEALCRWTPETGEDVPPSVFIPLAEQTGLILPLTAWVHDQVVRQVRSWREQGREVRCAVNLSMAALADPDASAALLDQLIAAADAVTVEITESWLVDARGREVITKLASNGVRLSLDDFGTGFSSLAALHRFPVQQVKLDRAFVLGLDDERGHQVLLAMASLGRSLGMEVVAEGVEQEHTAQWLRDAGVQLGQGFLWSPAVQPAALEPWWPPQPPANDLA